MQQRLFHPDPFDPELQAFVDTAVWRFATSYAATWPHEYVVRTEANAAMILRLGMHILEHGTPGRFYARVQQHYYQDGHMYWYMSTPQRAGVINRCLESQSYTARKAAGTLPEQLRSRR